MIQNNKFTVVITHAGSQVLPAISASAVAWMLEPRTESSAYSKYLVDDTDTEDEHDTFVSGMSTDGEIENNEDEGEEDEPESSEDDEGEIEDSEDDEDAEDSDSDADDEDNEDEANLATITFDVPIDTKDGVQELKRIAAGDFEGAILDVEIIYSYETGERAFAHKFMCVAPEINHDGSSLPRNTCHVRLLAFTTEQFVD